MIKIKEAHREIERHNDTIVIFGDGWSLKQDLIAIPIGLDADYASLGRSIKQLSKCDHWFNVDSDEAVWWADNLPKINRAGDFPIRHTLGECKNFDVDWDIIGIPWAIDDVMWHGSTALFAVMCCDVMGYGKIILAGCPLDSKGHWYFTDIDGPKWVAETYQAWFEFLNTEAAKKVRSFSGYTMQMCGYPDGEFLCGQDPK